MSVKAAIAHVLPTRLIAPIIQRRTWTNRVSSEGDDHLSLYWNSVDNPRRRELIKIIAAELRGAPKPASVLEFGSHVGVNLKLLAETLGLEEAKYFAIEPNFEAVEFLRSKLPAVRVLRGDHRSFLRARNFPGSDVTLSFANAVFYALSPRAARRVLRKLLATSGIVVIGDNLDNSRGAKSQFREDHGSFAHPFETWMAAAGVSVVRVIPVDSTDYALSGFLIATTKRAPTAS
jgi:SAM-dependent methyltransferase